MDQSTGGGVTSQPKFPLGEIMATAHVLNQILQIEINQALFRHERGDWGELHREDIEANERALKSEGRLFSRYHSSKNIKFYIITERDRSVTNVELHISSVMLSLQKC